MLSESVKKTWRHAEQAKPKLDMSLLRPAYSKQLSISVAKKNDLVKLCSSQVIPRQHHQFYMTLPTSDSVNDRLPQPDATKASATGEESNAL